MFTSLSFLALVAMSAVGCDVDETTLDIERAVALDDDDDDLALDAETPPLVSESPDQIDGFSPVGFDSERQLYVYDQDADGFPDITEALDDTDMLDPNSNAAIDDEIDALGPDPQAAFPNGNCRNGFQHAGPQLCISKKLRPKRRFQRAVNNCRKHRSTVCSYEDLTYLYLNTDDDEDYNPKNKWIGNIVGDNKVLCGNRAISYDGDPDWRNFEGVCNKNDKRRFWCCHDDDAQGDDDDDDD